MSTDADDVRHANIDLINRYALAVHKRDWTTFAGLFTADAVFTARRTLGFGGGEEGAFEVQTPEKIVEATAGPIESLAETHTIITNHVVDPAPDNQSAEMSCYFRAYHAGKGERAHLFEESLGRFEIRTIRQGSAWKIRRVEETVMVMLGTVEAFGH